MHIVIIGDTFPPMRTSGAVMLKDLADEFIAQGHTVTVIIPSDAQTVSVVEKINGNLQVLFVKAFKTKDIGYFQRTLAEFFNPFFMWSRLRRFRPFLKNSVRLVVWYSPSIFWGPLVKRIRGQWNCPSYLVLRDIFPDWAADLGLLSKFNPALYFFRWVAIYQYKQADAIGVQSPNNRKYLLNKNPKLGSKLQVLWNWMRDDGQYKKCSLRVSETTLAGKKIFVYAGNIGVAQGANTFMRIIKTFSGDERVGFLFIGRGSEMAELKERISSAHIKNVLFYPEISSDEINDLYNQCSAGIVVLDQRHKTHNIPGKFVSYMHAGLPVFGVVNPGNDLLDLVGQHSVGIVASNCTPEFLEKAANSFVKKHLEDLDIRHKCRKLFFEHFSSSIAFSQIRKLINY